MQESSRRFLNLNLLLAAPLLLLAACSTTKVSSKFLPPREEIRQVAAVDPVVSVRRLEVGADYLDTTFVPDLVENYHASIDSVLTGIQVSPLAIPDSQAANFRGSLRRFFGEAHNIKHLDSLTVSPNLLDILKVSPVRYVVLSSVTGLDRSGGSIALATTGSVLLGLVTLGMIYYVPAQSNLSLNTAIVDRDVGKVIYLDWKSVAGKPRKPTLMKTAQTQVFKTLNEPAKTAKR